MGTPETNSSTSLETMRLRYLDSEVAKLTKEIAQTGRGFNEFAKAVTRGFGRQTVGRLLSDTVTSISYEFDFVDPKTQIEFRIYHKDYDVSGQYQGTSTIEIHYPDSPVIETVSTLGANRKPIVWVKQVLQLSASDLKTHRYSRFFRDKDLKFVPVFQVPEFRRKKKSRATYKKAKKEWRSSHGITQLRSDHRTSRNFYPAYAQLCQYIWEQIKKNPDQFKRQKITPSP